MPALLCSRVREQQLLPPEAVWRESTGAQEARVLKASGVQVAVRWRCELWARWEEEGWARGSTEIVQEVVC